MHCKYVNSGAIYLAHGAVGLYTRCFSFSMLGAEYVPPTPSANGGTTHTCRMLEAFIENPEEIIRSDWNNALKRGCGIHKHLLTEKELSDFPENMTIGGGYICNNAQCKHCFRKGVVSPNDKRDEVELLALLDALRGVHFSTLAVSNFCEFMAYPWAVHFLQKPNEWDVVNVLTNGTTVTPDALESLPEKVKFTVSIDGTTEEAFGEVRGNSDYHQVMDITARMAEQNRLHLVDYTVYEDNIEDACRMPEWAKANGFADRLFVGFALQHHPSRMTRSFRILANCMRAGLPLHENSENMGLYLSLFPDKDPDLSEAELTEIMEGAMRNAPKGGES
jgi:hypothetical protein